MNSAGLDGDKICIALCEFAAHGASLDQILEEAVRSIHASHEHFHWTGIYELLPDNVLRLGPFIGEDTDHVLIPVGKGVCGSAVAEGRNKIVADVSHEPNYLACSASTKSELVVLIRKGAKIFAQIDIDSHNLDAFDDHTVRHLQKVADWLADAYQVRASLNTMP
jgi:L-methionine (R)-S-oxide reductase